MCVFFLFKCFYFSFVSFLKEKDKAEVQRGGWEGREHLGEIEGEKKTEIRIYFIKKLTKSKN